MNTSLLKLGFSGLLAFSLMSCEFFTDSKKNNTSKNPSTGNYIIFYPTDNQRVRLDTTFNIQWKPGAQISDPYVTIELYQEDTFVQTIATRTENEGSYSWRVSPPNGSGVYRIRIVNYSDTTQADFSFEFQIISNYTGTYVINSPASGFEAKLDSALAINWTSTGNPGASVSIWLYKDTLAVSSIVSSTSNDGAHVWSRVASSLGTGDDYRIKIASISDPGLAAYSEFFTIRSAFQGSFTITSPANGDTLQAGSTYDIDWTVTGTPATSVRLELFEDSTLVSTITTTTTQDGNLSWTVPAGYPSSNQYRIEITSIQDAGISNQSHPFVIVGVDPDDYEPDNDSANATTLTLAETQTHTVNLNDSDWYAIQVDSGAAYIVNTTGTRVYTYIYQAGSSSYDERFITTGPNWWTPSTTGTYYIFVYNYSNNYGEYTLSVTPMDSLKVTFTNPTGATLAQAGESFTVQWDTTTSNLFGANVRLALMRETMEVISSSTVVNDGEQAISIPAGFSSGSNYRIRMQSYNNTNMTVYSDSFSISGVARDAFETDDSLEIAKPIAKDGTPQNRTLSYQDEDWAGFSAVEGYTYIINIRGDIYARLYITDSAGSNLQTQTTINPSLGFTPTANGTYYIRVSYYTSSYYGDYSLSLLEVNPDSADDRIVVSNPDTATVWAISTSYTINWNPDSTLLGDRVTLALYKDTNLIQNIVSSTANDGEQTWAVPAGLITGNDYSIRVVNYNIQEIFGQSGRFTISGLAADNLEPDNTRDSAVTVTPDGASYSRSLPSGDQDWMSFTASAGSHYMAMVSGNLRVTLTVYEDTAVSALSSITTTNPILALQDAKAAPYVWRVSGSSYGDYQIRFVPFTPDSLVTFTNPIATSVLSAGSNYSIAWEPDTTYFKSTVTLYLHKGGRRIISLGSATMLSGQRSWTIPAGLASGSDYTIRMEASTLSNVYASSPAFSISGIAADSFEPNDSAAQATSIVADGSIQTHNLTYQDVDWFSFTATAQTVYQITTTQPNTLVPSIVLYSDNGATQLNSSTASDTAHSLVWFADASEDLQFRISASTRTGDYTVSVQAYDPSSYQFTVTQPTVGSVYAAGDTVDIAWNSQVDLGGNVDIFLFNGAGVVQTIQANRANSGTHTWIVPASLTAGTDYYIRIISRISSDINGTSELFTVN